MDGGRPGGACQPGLLVLPGPLEVRFSDRTALQPDVLVCSRSVLETTHLERPPLLVVEVRSPSTARYDALTKRSVCEEAGVPSYWLVDPDRPSVRVLELEGDRYADRGEAVGDTALEVQRPFPVAVPPSDLVR